MSSRLRARARAQRDTRTPSHRVTPPVASPGEPLGLRTRSTLEAPFRHSFEHVRIHDDAAADGFAESLAANAVTVGEDVYFADGAYDPHSSEGLTRLAHELTHTIQQGPIPSGQPLEITHPAERSEREAADISHHAVMGHQVHVESGTGPVAAREFDIGKLLNKLLEKVVPGPVKPTVGDGEPKLGEDPRGDANRQSDENDADKKGQGASDPLGDALKEKPKVLGKPPEMILPKPPPEPLPPVHDPLEDLWDPNKSWPPIFPDAPKPVPVPDDQLPQLKDDEGFA